MSAPSAALPRLHRWYLDNARDLPWRRTRDPYAIWVSEVMLQQTRVSAVVPYYERWMARLPVLPALAAAEEQEVLKLWEGLGYYSRARNLQQAARLILTEHGGRVPLSPSAFRALPGVGAYTAAAVLSIAAGVDLAAVDGNVKRVIARIAALDEPVNTGPGTRAIQRFADEWLPRGAAGLHNQALMELGALVCLPRRPLCEQCPLTESCQARLRGVTATLPRRTPRRAVPHVDVAVGVVFDGGKVFLDQRPYDGMLAGLWEFPGGKVEPGESPLEALARELWEEFGLRAEPLTALAPVHHAYTHLRVTLHAYVCRYQERQPAVGEGRPWRWVPFDELADYPMPTANRHILAQLHKRDPAP